MNSISVKELRQNFPSVRAQLKKGEKFIVIYQSKPIATLEPLGDRESLNVEFDEDMEAAALSDLDSFTDPDEYLNEDQIKYYLSLR